MSAAPLPENEEQRLEALRGYNVLDTPAEDEYDNIVKLASTICGTPISLVSLVDKERQWFKARTGLDALETHRDLAFCSHAIHTPTEPFVVEDATKDPRFAENELVTGPPNIRFYAGCPLLTPDGYALGTLCTIDIIPRQLRNDQIEALKILADNVVTLLQLRKLSIERKELAEKLTESNQELENFAHIASHDLKSPLRAIGTLTEWLEEDAEGLLTPKCQEHIQKIRDRTDRMHKLLDDLLNYSRINFDETPAQIVTTSALIEEVKGLLDIPEHITLETHESLQSIEIPQIPLLQVFQNLISNAIKHHDKKQGKIVISAREENGFYHFTISDNGPGIPERFHAKIFEMFQVLKPRDEVEGSGIGLPLVKKIITKLGGEVSIDSEEGKGSTFTFTFPKKELNTQKSKRAS